MAQLEGKLGDMVGREVFLISMTVDPKTDTLELLMDYAERFGAGAGWSFVTGKPEDIRAINYKFGDRSGVISECRRSPTGRDFVGGAGQGATPAAHSRRPRTGRRDRKEAYR
jgi:cytochrome oxidase Cu insertion factor (SCO1/SenC/PrrC family)